MTDPRHTRRYRVLQKKMRDKAIRNDDRCWICGGRIDYLAPPHHPDSWELDHIKSVDSFPELAYDPTNCASSHCSCNRSRGKDGIVKGLGKRTPRMG